jgi:hypothetical protein
MVTGGPQGPGTGLQVTFDGQADGAVIGAIAPCLTSPNPSNTLALLPPGYHVISSFGASAVFFTSTPSTAGNAGIAVGGQSITVNGAGFGPSNPFTVTFYLNGGGTVTAEGNTDANGGVTSTTFLSNGQLAGGDYVYWKVKDNFGNYAYGDTVLANVDNPPTISVSRNSGPAGLTVTVSGTNYPPAFLLNVYFLGTALVAATTNASGSFSTTITIPTSLNLGQYWVWAGRGAVSGGATWFTITAPTFGINPASFGFAPGAPPPLPYTATVTAGGTGWLPNEQVSIEGGPTFTTNAQGSFGGPKTPPNMTMTFPSVGSYIEIATDASGNEAMTLVWVGILGPC